MKVLLLLLLSISASALVQADPLTLHEGAGDGWFQVLNDDFIGKSPDDNLTAAWKAGVTVDSWLVGAEYDMETRKYENKRMDSFALTIGHSYSIHNLTLTPALGATYNGDLDGTHLQNMWHKDNHIDTVKVKYEDSAYTPLALLDLRYRQFLNETFGLIPIIQVATNTHATTVDVYTELTVTNQVGSDVAHFFIAPHYSHTWGHDVSQTQTEVNSFYNQFSLAIGLCDKPFMADINVGPKGSYGEIGVTF
jgi:hypothetical protein